MENKNERFEIELNVFKSTFAPNGKYFEHLIHMKNDADYNEFVSYINEIIGYHHRLSSVCDECEEKEIKIKDHKRILKEYEKIYQQGIENVYEKANSLLSPYNRPDTVFQLFEVLAKVANIGEEIRIKRPEII